MKAAFVDEFGPVENIRFGNLPMPLIGPRDVLVKVTAVAVNPVDTYIRSGKVAMNPNFPFIIGRDMVGEVVAVGSGVTRFSPRQRVWSNSQGIHGRQGTFAEYVSVNERLLYRLPENVDEQQMVAFVHSGLTAITGLQRVGLRPGETLFLNGGSGNVGSAIIQLAKARGARILATAGTAEGLDWCRTLGADEAVNYRDGRVDEAIHAFVPEGFDVYWDTSGKPDFEVALKRLAMRGRIVLMSGVDANPPFPVGSFYTKNAVLLGFSVTWLDEAELQEAADQLNSWAASGQMKVRIRPALPLAQAVLAHRLIEEGMVRNGKIVLRTDSLIPSSPDTMEETMHFLREEKKNAYEEERQIPDVAVPGGTSVSAQLQSILQQPAFAAFIEELQRTIETQPHYLEDHRSEMFTRTLAILASTGQLRETQPSEQDVEEALRAAVSKKDRS